MNYGANENGEAIDRNKLLLNLTSKSNLFTADQTPTPTRLIKNCEEVGLFDDLRHVNPFEETFRLACQDSVQDNPIRQVFNANADEDSLHTPQVFPQLQVSVENEIRCNDDLTGKQTLDNSVPLDVEQPAQVSANDSELTKMTFSADAETSIITPLESLIIPKLPTKNQTNAELLPTTTTTLIDLPNGTTSLYLPNKQLEPSSASLTPTSQLPIKERLKAILNQNGKSHSMEWSHRNFGGLKKSNMKTSTVNDIMERRRAASSRYRHKIRSEYKDLKKSNAELLQENEKLKTKIAKLEKELQSFRSSACNASNHHLPNQLQIPASTVHLVMSIPNLIVPFFVDAKNQYCIE